MEYFKLPEKGVLSRRYTAKYAMTAKRFQLHLVITTISELDEKIMLCFYIIATTHLLKHLPEFR